MEVTRLSVDRHFSCSGGGTSLTLTRRNRVTHWLMWLWLKISLGFGDATFSDEAIWDGHCRYKICCLPEWNMTMEHSPHIEWFFLASKHHVCRVFPCLITMEGANMTCGCLSSPCEVQTWNPMRLWWPRGLSPWSGIPEGFEQNRGAHKRLPAMTRYTQFHTP
jgi:hypothetical protein